LLSLAATAKPQSTPATEPAPPAAHVVLNDQQLEFPISYSDPARDILVCDRAIYVLKTGYAQHWQKPAQYIEAFKKFPVHGTWNDDLGLDREMMIEFLTQSLPESHAQDAQTLLDAHVTRSIQALERAHDYALSIEAKGKPVARPCCTAAPTPAPPR
jgi:hypothetical protein